jgi:twinkle protein
MTLSPKHAVWLESREIDPETALAMGLYSARWARGGDPVPDAKGDVLVFRYIENGQEVNTKFRAPGKRIWQRKDARKTFFNAEVLTDPALLEDRFPLVITEGEIDALSFLQAGYPFVVSVPDGAPPARDAQGNIVQVPEDADDVDPANDEKYRYVLNCWDRLAKIRRIVLAGDGDEPGWRLCQELARRLGKARCSFVSYPQDCKDANEVLVSHGPAEVMKLVDGVRGPRLTAASAEGAASAHVSRCLHGRLRASRGWENGLDRAAGCQHGEDPRLAGCDRFVRDARLADAS